MNGGYSWVFGDALAEYVAADAELTARMYKAIVVPGVKPANDLDEQAEWEWRHNLVIPKTLPESKLITRGPELRKHLNLPEEPHIEVVSAFEKAPILEQCGPHPVLGRCPECGVVGVVGTTCPACVGECSVCDAEVCEHTLAWRVRTLLMLDAYEEPETVFNVLQQTGLVCRMSNDLTFSPVYRKTGCGDLIKTPDADWTCLRVTCFGCMSRA